MAHEAGTVNGTWHFPPGVVLTAVFSLLVSSPYRWCPLPNPLSRCGGQGPKQPRTLPCVSDGDGRVMETRWRFPGTVCCGSWMSPWILPPLLSPHVPIFCAFHHCFLCQEMTAEETMTAPGHEVFCTE